ncbi:unnamed protein product [Lactuca virosa]|uniref:Uncharacterized protein n=1 Tax=Lactuca virosa TaxID=75947 RepID=A0AAU9NTX3_9ASTR|nr:unnamed protein product [Lactuca virosa]
MAARAFGWFFFNRKNERDQQQAEISIKGFFWKKKKKAWMRISYHWVLSLSSPWLKRKNERKGDGVPQLEKNLSVREV